MSYIIDVQTGKCVAETDGRNNFKSGLRVKYSHQYTKEVIDQSRDLVLVNDRDAKISNAKKYDKMNLCGATHISEWLSDPTPDFLIYD